MSDRDLSASDIDLLREILDLARSESGLTGESALFAVLQCIERLLGCDGVAHHVIDAVHEKLLYAQESCDGEELVLTEQERRLDMANPAAQFLWSMWWVTNCSLPERTGSDLVATIRTWYGEREWREHPLHRTSVTAEDQALIAYPIGHGVSLRILAPRETGSPFGTREMTLLELLSPHLYPLLAEVYTPPAAPAGALTVRQLEILRLVELGLTNRGIARRLGVSEATVRKHLENSFSRLGVLSRTEAVSAAFGPRSAPAIPATRPARPLATAAVGHAQRSP